MIGHGARAAVDLDDRPVGDPTSGVVNRDRTRDTELPADDHGMAHRCADVDHDRLGRDEQRGPTRVGVRSDEHVAGLEPARIAGVEHDPGSTPGDPDASRQPGDAVADPELVHRGRTQLPLLERWHRALDVERWDPLRQPIVELATLGDRCTERCGVGDVGVEFLLQQEPQVAAATAGPRHQAAVQLLGAEARSVNGLDDRRLGAFATLHVHPGAAQHPRDQTTEGPPESTHHVRFECVALACEAIELRVGGVGRVGEPHAIDERQGQLRVGLPCVECRVPLVGAAGTERRREGGEVVEEGRHGALGHLGRLDRCVQAGQHAGHARVELGGEYRDSPRSTARAPTSLATARRSRPRRSPT